MAKKNNASQDAATAEAIAATELESAEKLAAAEAAALAQADAEEAGEHIYRCLNDVHHNGTIYSDTIALTADEAEPLLASRAITE